MRKILSTLSAFLLLLGVSSASAQEFPANSTMAKLQEKGQLHVGVKFDQPLFGLRNLSGKPVGFDIEIAKLIAKKLGIKESNITFVETSSANREPFLQQKKVDYVVATYAMNAKRKKVLNFAGPYVIGGQDLIVQKGNPKNIKGPQDLAGKKVCVMNGSEGQSAIVNNYPDAQTVPFDVISKCVEALKNGSVDAVATTNFILAGLVSREPSKLEILGNMFTREPWGVGMRKDEVDLCKFVQNVLIEADKDGTYKEIYDKFLQDYVPGDGKLPPLDPCE